MVGLATLGGEPHTLALVFSNFASLSVRVSVLFWHGDGDPMKACGLEITEITVKALWCECGRGVEVTLFPLWQNPAEHDRLLTLAEVSDAWMLRRRLSNTKLLT